MPQLGESVVEGTINSWLVKEGDHVNQYDPIADVMTDKVNAEIPTFVSGLIKDIVIKEGETIQVGEVICYIETEENLEGNGENSEQTGSQKTSALSNEQNNNGQSMRKRYSPAVLRMSQDHNVDLGLVDGTGLGGRITRKDIEEIIESGKISTVSDEAKVLEREELFPKQQSTVKGDVEIPFEGVRKVIADNMVKSKEEIPHAWMTIEVDVTDLVNYRKKVKDEFKQSEGFNLTYFAFFIKAVAQALKEYPLMNCTWVDDKLIQKKDINVSIAVAKENELFVPVIKQADEKSIKGIAKDISYLAQKARTGKLVPEDMQDGTFTVNNTGYFGSIHSMGVINYPQIAILQVESIVKRPVIINDMFAARDMINLSLSLDHRILDGLICGRFLARVKAILENMNEKTLSAF